MFRWILMIVGAGTLIYGFLVAVSVLFRMIEGYYYYKRKAERRASQLWIPKE
jgi:predicted LPLAT superfamily acyltransferase